MLAGQARVVPVASRCPRPVGMWQVAGWQVAGVAAAGGRVRWQGSGVCGRWQVAGCGRGQGSGSLVAGQLPGPDDSLDR